MAQQELTWSVSYTGAESEADIRAMRLLIKNYNREHPDEPLAGDNPGEAQASVKTCMAWLVTKHFAAAKKEASAQRIGLDEYSRRAAIATDAELDASLAALPPDPGPDSLAGGGLV